jgi:hypothetical protein
MPSAFLRLSHCAFPCALQMTTIVGTMASVSGPNGSPPLYSMSSSSALLCPPPLPSSSHGASSGSYGFYPSALARTPVATRPRRVGRRFGGMRRGALDFRAWAGHRRFWDRPGPFPPKTITSYMVCRPDCRGTRHAICGLRFGRFCL